MVVYPNKFGRKYIILFGDLIIPIGTLYAEKCVELLRKMQ